DRQSWRCPVRAARSARALCETDPPQSGGVRSLALVTRQTVLSGCSNQFLARRSLMVSEAQSLPRGGRRPIWGKLENPGQGCPWGNGAIVVREISIVVLAVSLLATASTAPPPAMSEDVRRRLAAGEVVVTDDLPPGASETAHGGTAVAILRASP